MTLERSKKEGTKREVPKGHLSNEKNLGWLVDIGDAILPSFLWGLFHKP